MITFTDFAASKVKELLDAHNMNHAGVRIFLKASGCAGYDYGMSIDENRRDDDKVLENKGIKIFVDAASFPLIDGSEVDYLESAIKAGFSVNNPNTASACSCSSSYSPDGQVSSCQLKQ